MILFQCQRQRAVALIEVRFQVLFEDHWHRHVVGAEMTLIPAWANANGVVYYHVHNSRFLGQ